MSAATDPASTTAARSSSTTPSTTCGRPLLSTVTGTPPPEPIADAPAPASTRLVAACIRRTGRGEGTHPPPPTGICGQHQPSLVPSAATSVVSVIEDSEQLLSAHCRGRHGVRGGI